KRKKHRKKGKASASSSSSSMSAPVKAKKMEAEKINMMEFADRGALVMQDVKGEVSASAVHQPPTTFVFSRRYWETTKTSFPLKFQYWQPILLAGVAQNRPEPFSILKCVGTKHALDDVKSKEIVRVQYDTGQNEIVTIGSDVEIIKLDIWTATGSHEERGSEEIGFLDRKEQAKEMASSSERRASSSNVASAIKSKAGDVKSNVKSVERPPPSTRKKAKNKTDTGSAEVRKHARAARMSSRLVHRNIVRLASSGLHLTAANIRRQASTHEGPNLSIDTVHVVCEVLVCLDIPSEEIADYRRGPRGALDWAYAHKNSTGERYVWSGESKFLLFGTDEIKFVQHPSSIRYHPRHRLPTMKSGSFAVTVHGSFCDKEVGLFHHIEGGMDFKIYFNIMETVFDFRALIKAATETLPSKVNLTS
ncbi:hypothetical protein TELCIR_11445, partial [Teladorsagia circumcincta]